MKNKPKPRAAGFDGQHKRWRQELKKNPPTQVSVKVIKHKVKTTHCHVTVIPQKPKKPEYAIVQVFPVDNGPKQVQIIEYPPLAPRY